jgi:large subunit ribosomal protein L10
VNREEKKEFVKSLNEAMTSSNTVIVVHYHGLTVKQITALRSEMRQLGASFKVVKNSLAKLAAKGTEFEPLEGLFSGPTAVAFSEDPVSAAKGIVAFAKENEALKIIGAIVDKQLVDVAGVKSLATMPSLDELRAKIVGIISTPARNIAAVLLAPAGQIARVLNAYGSKE